MPHGPRRQRASDLCGFQQETLELAVFVAAGSAGQTFTTPCTVALLWVACLSPVRLL